VEKIPATDFIVFSRKKKNGQQSAVDRPQTSRL
jgi:hypothetical protein